MLMNLQSVFLKMYMYILYLSEVLILVANMEGHAIGYRHVWKIILGKSSWNTILASKWESSLEEALSTSLRLFQKVNIFGHY